jgi:hypothetical protein
MGIKKVLDIKGNLLNCSIKCHYSTATDCVHPKRGSNELYCVDRAANDYYYVELPDIIGLHYVGNQICINSFTAEGEDCPEGNI